MEGARDTSAAEGNLSGLAALVPVFALIVIAVWFGFGVVFLSVSSITYRLSFEPVWPPNFSGYASFFGGLAGTILGRSLAFAVTVTAAAVPLALLTGYCLALKAPGWLRRTGVFLLLAAWALTFERLQASFHFFPLSPLGQTFPWLAISFGGDITWPLAWLVTPPVALAAYAGFRGRLFGLRWPTVQGTRLERWVREAVPRAVAGTAFGALIAILFLATDPLTPVILGGASGRTIGSYIWSTTASLGFVTAAAVAVAIAGLVILVACAAFGAVLWLVHRVAPHWAAVRVRPLPARGERFARIASSLVTGIAAGFTLFSLFLPLAASAVFSFNSENSFIDFSSFSTRWWTAPANDIAVPPGLLNDPYFATAFWGSLGLAAFAAAMAAPLAFLAVRFLPRLRPWPRALARACIYFGLVAPLFITTTMAYMRASWDAQEPATDATHYLPFAVVPLALAVAFLVCEAALHQSRRSGYVPWPALGIRTVLAGGLTAFAFGMNAGVLYPGSLDTVPAFMWAFLARRVPTLETDAAVTLMTALTLVVLAGAFLTVHDREAFTM